MYFPFFLFFCDFRDAGLKRAKVKDVFKEEQQQLYSKALVGERDKGDQGAERPLEDNHTEKEKI